MFDQTALADEAARAPRRAAVDDAPAAASRLDWLYLEACRLLLRHLGDTGYGVPQLVSELQASRPTVYRAFARHGATVAGRQRELRLMKVRELLAQPPFRTPIETLAWRCGFEDVRTFSRCFRRQFGVSAGAYRAQVLARVVTGEIAAEIA